MTESTPAQPPLFSAELAVEVDTSLDERLLALRASGAKLKPGVRAMLGWRYWLVIAITCAMSWGGVELAQSHPLPGVLLIAFVFLGLVLWAQRQRFVLLARGAIAQYRVGVSSEGLRISSEIGESRLGWNAVSAVESRSDATLIFLRGYQCLLIPHRCFADDDAHRTFVTQIEAALMHRIPDARVEAIASPDSFGAALWSNLLTGLLWLGMRTRAMQCLRPSVPQLIALTLLGIAIGLSGDLLRFGWGGQFNAYALPTALYGVPWLLLCAWATARLAGNEKHTLHAAVGMQVMWCWLGVLMQIMSFLPASWWRIAGEWGTLIWWLPFAYGMVISVLILIRATGLPAEQRVGALLIVIYLLALPLGLTPRSQGLWVASEETSSAASAAQRERWEAPTREAILYSQPRLLAETLNRIKPGLPGKPELFLLALGGHGNQDVFMREVKSVEQLFAQRFGTAGHSAVLLNNPATLNEYPLASVTSLKQVVQGMAQRMNRDEDVLFLFMTSHGGDDYRFDLSMWPFKFDDLTPQRLKAVLDKAGIRHRVVVVSSCYSGGFVPPLADAETWVMTAARADRNSHGCSHEADWTFFGRAYFNEALRQTKSFEQAFDIAKKSIAEREKSEALTPSEPQTGGGEAVKRILDKMPRASTG
ncbi:MAG: hypothetical protein JWL63_109 [Rhodocyclales bacterium]|nr:hypothetical protein [Rhodocyclales bacterium]